MNLVLRSAHAQTSLRSLRKLNCGARVSMDSHERDSRRPSFEPGVAPPYREVFASSGCREAWSRTPFLLANSTTLR
jgi:hypothetical protein